MAINIIADTNGWLSFNNIIPRLFITAETDDFDEIILQEWQDEGFEVTYVPFTGSRKAYVRTLHGLADGLDIGNSYAIVAFGDAAAVCLETHIHPTPKLCALIAYYPTSIPDTHNTHYPPNLRVLVHLAGGSVGVNRNSEVFGIQGKRRTVQKRINAGIGLGGTLLLSYPSYKYESVDPGFAEHDLEEWDGVAAGVAWSRSLRCVRSGFRAEVELEKVWEDCLEQRFATRKPENMLRTMSARPTPHVTYSPTSTGGVGADDLSRFYAEFFMPGIPPTLKMRLLSRTVGVDRIVDELYTTFRHTCEVPWILPRIPPTNKKVEITIVSIVAFRGGRLVSEHVYWDQASVLAQVGLLDLTLVSKTMKGMGVTRLPVVGREGARKILNERFGKWNELIPDWEQGADEATSELEDGADDDEAEDDVRSDGGNGSK